MKPIISEASRRIGVIESGGNIASLIAAIARAGHQPVRLKDADALQAIDQLVLPGQGRFATVMNTLDAMGWRAALLRWRADNKPLLGICVGLQVLFESSDEDPDTRGLGILRGRVRRLDSPKQPMMGWSRVSFPGGQVPDGDAYFVNSFVVTDSDAGIGYAEYGQKFCAVVQSGNWLACQFHPEKSGAYGARLMQQWLS